MLDSSSVASASSSDRPRYHETGKGDLKSGVPFGGRAGSSPAPAKDACSGRRRITDHLIDLNWGACNNAPVTRGSDVVQDPMIASFRPLGASTREEADLGPISPELALVDSVLAERARTLLPEPRALPRRRPTSARAEVPRRPVAQGPARAPATRSTTPRLRRIVVLSAIIFAAGAASAEFLGRRDATSPRGLLEVWPGTPAGETRARESTPPSAQKNGTARAQTRNSRDGQPSVRSRKRRPGPPAMWAANVLGVTAAVDTRGVRLSWQSPAGSRRIVVLRTRDDGKHSVMLFRGRATSIRDKSPRPCRTYRYTIVNYDRGGHRSTGVPTSVVTGGCA